VVRLFNTLMVGTLPPSLISAISASWRSMRSGNTSRPFHRWVLDADLGEQLGQNGNGH